MPRDDAALLCRAQELPVYSSTWRHTPDIYTQTARIDELYNCNTQEPDGLVITFGYHSSVMSKKRGFAIREICLISHGGAQHDTIATVKERIKVTEKEIKI